MADAVDFAVEPPHHQKWDAENSKLQQVACHNCIKLQATGMRMNFMQCCFLVKHGPCEQSISASTTSLLVNRQLLYHCQHVLHAVL